MTKSPHGILPLRTFFILNFGGTMKYCIELKRVSDSEWRQYKTYDSCIVAHFNAFRGRVWANFLLCLRGVDQRIETRVVPVYE